MMPNLHQVAIGQKVKITKIEGEDQTKMQLISLGILEGDTLEITGKAPLGSPLAIKHGDNHFFALRKEQASLIEVETLN